MRWSAVTLDEGHPGLDELLADIGEAGRRVAEICPGGGAAGNLSVLVGWPVEIAGRFPVEESIALDQPAPALAGKLVIATGSGCRLRDLLGDPAANLGVVAVDAGGVGARLCTSPGRRFERLTTELNSHLAVHGDQAPSTDFLALVHAQPLHLTYLSHVAAYRDEDVLNRRLARWEPETIISLPEGIGVIPFEVPGSAELMAATILALRSHPIAVWSKHGVIARSGQSIGRAVDLIEYAETAATFEYLDLVAGGRADGLTTDELAAIADAFFVETDVVGPDRR